MQQQQLAVRLSAAEGPAVLEGVSTLVLDCDGVLWRGSELMPGTVQALQRFREMGKRLLFLTNNSSKSRRAYKVRGGALASDFFSTHITSHTSHISHTHAAGGLQGLRRVLR